MTRKNSHPAADLHPKRRSGRLNKGILRRGKGKGHPRPPRMKPDIDPLLKPVLSRIGKPALETFQPDPFQLEALAAITNNDCLVMAPTGSGKTWIAEEAIHSVFSRGGRCWYASPLKALTNAKWVEFSRRFDPVNV
ncbi:MAG: DEAD/DEAH box helicase, partial [Syntrophaceae bacterium]|nr:DEAD/DEAH box helicase [Syntrophaceae bacterium]